MNSMLLKLYVQLQTLGSCEDGQDMVEYSLLVTLIALATITGIRGVASGVNLAFSNISSSLA
jgi:pilus assembly protein Flp/PilA